MQLSPDQQKALEAQKAQCPFCKIIKGEIPSKKVYEDDKILAILDINPASKGHLLVMPKEHYPIMPLIPPETFEHLAIKTKDLSKAIKEGALVFGTNIFIANGAAAGQQSQHFMLHIIPREEGDGISMFDFEKINVDKAKDDEAFKILSHNLPKMLKDVYKRFPLKGVEQQKVSYSKDELLKIIEANPQLKDAIMKNPSQFKQMIPSNPQLKLLFENIDVDDIIETITGKKITNGINSEFNAPQASQLPTNIKDDKFSAIQKAVDINQQHDEEDDENGEGADIVDIIEGNPKLKELIINDPETLKQKIIQVPQLKELFENVDIDKLREHIIKNQSKNKNKRTEDKDYEKDAHSSDENEGDDDKDISNLLK